MDISEITKLISLVLAVSLASERLVTLLKTLIPQLASPPPTSAGETPPEKGRQLLVMFITFLIAWITATFLKQPFHLFGYITLSTDPSAKIYFVFIGFLASGGSAFWSSLLGYTTAVKSLRTQQLVSEKLTLKAQLFENRNTLSFSDKAAVKKRSSVAGAVELEIRQIILDVSELPGDPSALDSTSLLSDLGFNNAMCGDLAQRLDGYVKTINPQGHVNNAEISSGMTVQQVIDLIKQKIAQ